MKYVHWNLAHWNLLQWDLSHGARNFDSADISTFAILGAAIILILLMIVSLFFNIAPQTELLVFPGA